jgi:F0F1-type ATP synthase membrane subunit b/b'
VNALSHIALPAINFTIFMVTMIALLKKPLRVYVSSRKESFKLISDEATKKFRAAEERLALARARHERLDRDIAELIQKMESQGAREAESIITAAQERARRMHNDAEFNITRELTKLKHELYRDCVVNACARAEQELTTTLSRPDAASSLAARAEREISRAVSTIARSV